ncbi:retrovirus-related pol polyprotein from transposon TNT 1-94 [Tanacetum coccineum]
MSHGRQCLKPKRKRYATWFREKVLLVEAQGNGKVLNEKELEFLADPGIVEGLVTQSVITHNAAYQADDLDAYDLDCDEISTAKEVLMANFSSYGSDVLSKVPIFDNTNNDMLNQSVQEMSYYEPSHFVEHPDTNYSALTRAFDMIVLNNCQISKLTVKASYPITDQSASLPVKIEAPRELPKVTEVQTVFHQMEAAVQQYHIDKQCFKIQKKQFLNENDRLLDQIISQDIVNIVVISSVDVNTSVKVNFFVIMNDSMNYVEMYNKCLELKAELIKKTNMVEKDEYNRLSKRFSELEQHCISLEIAMKLNKEIFQKHNTSVNQTEPSFDQFGSLAEQVNSTNPLDSASYSTCAKALCSVCNECLFDANHAMCLIDHVNNMNVRAKSASKKNKKRKEWKPTRKVFNSIRYKWKPTGRTFTLVGNECHLTRIPATNKVPLKVPIPLEVVAPTHVVTRVYIRRPKVPKSVQNCQNLKGYDRSFPICLLSKATKTKSWLWHRLLSQLNFGAINHLARHGLVCGLPRLKFEKDHLCSTCAMGKSKKQSLNLNMRPPIQEKIYLLHMDLYGPMRVASLNGKKYILISVDDYSRFTWVKFLASKDEALDFIIKFIKMIRVRLNAIVRNIRTDNRTEFVNQTLRDYYEQFGISHETLVTRTPQQNGVVERRNRMFVEAAHTMLIFAQAPLFLWAEGIASACYTQNRSIIR